MSTNDRVSRTPSLVPLEGLRLSRGLSRTQTGGAGALGLVDGQQRNVTYLRLSVTDRCNFRCRYCMPEAGVPFVPRDEVLTFDETARLVRAFTRLGVRKVRLTGGEPTLRRDLVELVAAIRQVEGVEELAMTTNAVHLPKLAAPLREAGLDRLNVSIDTVRSGRFKDVTRTGSLERVLQGLDAAAAAGFTNTRLNCVVLKGFNDDELVDLVRFAHERNVLLRFIEVMPVGIDDFWSKDTYLSMDDVRARLGRELRLEDDQGFADAAGLPGGGPARYRWAVLPNGARVRVGFITALSHNFCGTCNRVRLTATGTLQECLAYPGDLSLRDAMRSGATDADLEGLVAGALFGKGPGHRFDAAAGGLRTFQSMSVTGG